VSSGKSKKGWDMLPWNLQWIHPNKALTLRKSIIVVSASGIHEAINGSIDQSINLSSLLSIPKLVIINLDEKAKPTELANDMSLVLTNCPSNNNNNP
jgi:hypothetical protein